MRKLNNLVIFVVVASALAMLVGGCGGSGSATGQTTPVSSKGDGKASAAFRGKGGTNHQATFGEEVVGADLTEVRDAVATYIKDRAAHQWAAQCGDLTQRGIREFEAEAPGEQKGKPCAKVLGVLAAGASPEELRNNLVGQVVAFRSNGQRGYAFFHGTGGLNWSMPMEQEGGEWKVAALIPDPLNR